MLDRVGLVAVLSKVDGNLDRDTKLCLIGSAVGILLGQSNRTTEDIDAWARASRFDEASLRRAVVDAGLGFDPKENFPDVPYLQIVHPGIVQVPGHDPAAGTWMGEGEVPVWQGRRLQVTSPPPRVVAASKLVRGSDTDLEDCLWLMAAHRFDAEAVLEAVRRLPKPAREAARDNLDILRLMPKKP